MYIRTTNYSLTHYYFKVLHSNCIHSQLNVSRFEHNTKKNTSKTKTKQSGSIPLPSLVHDLLYGCTWQCLTLNRNSPTGGWAYGTPRKARMPRPDIERAKRPTRRLLSTSVTRNSSEVLPSVGSTQNKVAMATNNAKRLQYKFMVWYFRCLA